MENELVRHLRTTLGVTQKDLAGRLGLNQSTVSRWERGVTRPDIATRRRLHALVESAVGEAESSLRLLVAHSPAPMALFDTRWRLHALSESFAALAGLDRMAATGIDFSRRFTPELEETARAAVARGLFTGEASALRVVCPLEASDGARTWTDGTWHALRLDGADRLLVAWQCRPLAEGAADRSAAILELPGVPA